MGFLGDVVQMNVGQILQTTQVPAVSMKGHTVIITGANTGLGFEAAKHFFQLGVERLILACRNASKGQKAREDILASSTLIRAGGDVEVWPLDLSSNKSVLAFGDRMQRLSRLDVFIANAGIDVNVFERSEGHESLMTVNHYGEARLITLGSVIHIFAKHQYLASPAPGQIFKQLDVEQDADMNDRYHLSKLMGLLCTRELAAKVSESNNAHGGNVIVTNVNPGWCQTELFRTHQGGVGARLGLWMIGRTAEEGSRTLVHAAAVPGEEVEHFHGKYLSECRVNSESTWVVSVEGKEVQRGLWLELLQILEGIKTGVTKV